MYTVILESPQYIVDYMLFVCLLDANILVFQNIAAARVANQ